MLQRQRVRQGMSARVDQSGVACCGNCGAELAIVCTGGCSELDVVFQENYIAVMRKPRNHFGEALAPYKKTLILHPGFCVELGCDAAVAPYSGRGRVPIKCPKHMRPSRARTAA